MRAKVEEWWRFDFEKSNSPPVGHEEYSNPHLEK